ncbi:MAG: glycosyltransferase [Nitrospira sp.]|nr:glycosyltransferase [Nitrospira sp.]
MNLREQPRATKPLFSIIVPTRQREEKLRCLFDSFLAMTHDLSRIEIVLVVDDDDEKSVAFEYPHIPIERVVVGVGLKMGELNMAGYKRSSGRFIMLLNDDVVIRTKDWDEKVLSVFKGFPDEIALVHVNDKIFQEKLCTFPFVSRTFCEQAGGICPPDYVRYRIDDHIYNVFNLLSVLGKTRIVYLPDVIFEHTNVVTTAAGEVEYKPNEAIHAIDTKRFDELLPARKELAVRLAGLIDQHLSKEVPSLRTKQLGAVSDSVSLRLPEYVRISSDHLLLTSENTRVTIGIVSANLRNEHAVICIDRVKQYTKNFDLIILDNNGGPNFNHSHEMNRILSICKTDYLLLMDDDVFAEPGWLDGMLRCMNPAVGVITPMHKDKHGNLSYAGVVMRPDYTGHHTHCLVAPELPVPIQTLCSAIMLIDVRKCGHLRIDESYSKYFLDIDYGLRVWEAGFSVVCSPYTMVTHLGGATLQQGSTASNVLFEQQRQMFVRNWMPTQRYKNLEKDIWSNSPHMRELHSLPRELDALLSQNPAEDRDVYCKRAHEFFARLGPYPALLDYSRERIWASLGTKSPGFDDPELGHLVFLKGFYGYPVLIERNYDGFNIVFWNGRYYAIPQSDGFFDPERLANQGYSRSFQAASMDLLKIMIAMNYQSQTGIPHRHSNSSVRLLQVIGEQRTGYASWKSGLRRGGLSSLKRLIVSLWGYQEFDRMKSKWIAMRSKQPARSILLSAPRFVLGVLLEGLTHRRKAAHPLPAATIDRGDIEMEKAEGDVQKWLDASPISLVEASYRGYSIYCFEYKFFAVPKTLGTFSYDDFKSGVYGQCSVGHTLPEIHATIDRLIGQVECPQHERGLFLACLSQDQLEPYIETLRLSGSLTVLAGRDSGQLWRDFDCIQVDEETLNEWAQFFNISAKKGVDKRILDGEFSHFILPWVCPEIGPSNALEGVAAKLTRRLDVIYPSGECRVYEGENLHRLWYNKAYLTSMFQAIGSPVGKSVLEIGCSDGLVCDIVSLLGARHVVGIDAMKSVGCNFPSAKIQYEERDAKATGLPDQSFDLVYSIATFEHISDPLRVLTEILRVMKVGGYAYVQAGPLYHSPFGHHMFAYFQDYPWIHLRKSKDEIKAYARERQIDLAVKRDLGITSDEYIDGMLNSDHLNGLFLEAYRLNDFESRSDVKVVKFHTSYEGRELLTADVLSEMYHFKPDCLIEHGFEIAFQRLR